MAKTNGKKTVADIIIERFLKDVDEKGTMPWQRPYESFNSFNYFTKIPYRGINRLLLPFGEYLTKNQITQYNKEKGYIVFDSNGKLAEVKPDAYKFQKGIIWRPVVFFKKDVKQVSQKDIKELFPDVVYNPNDAYSLIGRNGGYFYVCRKGVYSKERNILRYYEVADRTFFKNSYGECLPSRLETGEIVITRQKPQEVIDRYQKQSGVNIDTQYNGTPCYIPDFDLVQLNPHTKNEDSWFSTAFHELGHSTGSAKRLNRPGIVKVDKTDKNKYAIEECIAEICACLCCAETGIYDFKTSCSEEYDNNLAYVQGWKKRIKEWGKDFVYIASQADKAFNMICGNPDEDIVDSGENNKLK